MYRRQHDKAIRWAQAEVLSEPSPAAAPARSALGIKVPRSPAMRHGAVRRVLAKAMCEHGLPRLEGLSADEEARELLRVAAEIEHGLMVQYLYPLYACKKPQVAGALKRIAIEEMGHLLTVLNLLCASGQRPHLGRYDWSGSEFAPFPFKLEPPTRHSLAKYTVAEMPEADSEEIDDEQRAVLPDISSDAALPDASAPSRIGLLYAAVYWLLRPNDDPPPAGSEEPWAGFPVEDLARDPNHANRHVSAAFFSDLNGVQGTADDWRAGAATAVIETVRSREEALLAVARIAEQGEGFGRTPDGHFDQFVRAYMLERGSAAEPALVVPTDPWYAGAGSGAADAEITSVDGVKLARLGDLLYEAVLLSIGLYYALPAPVVDSRTIVAGVAVELMKVGLTPLCARLVEVERGAGQPGVAHVRFSGPPPAVASDAASLLARVIAVLTAASDIATDAAQTAANAARRAMATKLNTRIGEALSTFETIDLGGNA